MRPKRSSVLAGLTAVAVLLLCEGVFLAGGFDFLENRSFDLRVHLAPPREPPAAEILIIDIDNPSFAALRDAVGRWPWTRLLWAELVKYLHSAGARVIVFDAIFAGKESAEVDAEFARAIEDAGNVVLAFAFTQHEAERREDTHSPRATAVPGALPVKDEVGVERLPSERYQADLPFDPLTRAARGLGCITARPDPDGVVRRSPLFYRWGDHYYPALAVAAAAQARHLSPQESPRLTPTEFRWGGLRVPVSPDGKLVPHWRPRPRDYVRLPFWQVICSMFPNRCVTSQTFYKEEDFKDKIVIIGASLTAAFDYAATSMAPVTPGFLVQVSVLDSLLRQSAIRQPPKYAVHLLMVLFIGLALIAVWSVPRVRQSTAMVAALAALYLAAGAEAFGRWELWLPVAAPMAALGLSFVGQSLTRYVTTGRELRQTRQTLSRYMPPQVVEHILAHGGPDQLRGQRREITVMFSDVRNFTKMSEKRAPAEVLAILNRYLDAMTEIVFAHRGVVDKFIGDGILCYWGAFGDSDTHARLAATTAAKMVAKLEELNENWRAGGLPELNIGIGINTGQAVFGNLGAGKKIEFTVLGDTVNVASRLESMSKEFKVRVILSETTRAQLDDDAAVRLLDEVAIRGREQRMKVFELVSISEGGKTYETQPIPLSKN